ncbi:MAG TPA: hypothetical protein VNA69_10850 [Thermoanaerobaculia bacterium]|nr:hypothetical protein [Thermoanaerobaculia bacterium]
MSLLKSCLRWILLYLFIAAIFSALVYIRFPNVRVALIGGGASAVFVWFTLGYFNSLRERKAEKRMIRRGMSMDRPEDGEKIAAIGPVRSMESLEAPISKRPCLAYEYNMSTARGEGTAGIFTGFALVPLMIESPRGSIRLLAAPELDYPEEYFGGPRHRTNAREYIERTTFQKHEGLDIRREVTHMKTVMADDDGRIRYDIQRDRNVDLATLDFSEKILAPGEHVVAIGRYSAARGGLVPDPTALLHPVKMVKGNGEEVVRKLKGKDRTDRVMGCGCLVPVLIAAIIGLTIVPLEAIEQMFPQKDPSWTEVRVEQWVRRTVRPYFKDLGDVAIELQPGQARGKLFVDGANVPLTTCAARRDGGWLDVTFRGEGGAATARFLGNRLESLQIGGRTIASADVEVEQLRVSDEEALGRITYLGPRGGPHLRVTFRCTP